jgi:hypothetical protein
MNSSKERIIAADVMRLSDFLRNAADLDLQFAELSKLRRQVRQAQRSARKMPPTKLRRKRK